MGWRGRRARLIAVGILAGVAAVILGVLITTDDPTPRTSPPPNDTEPPATGPVPTPCEGLDADEVADAIGPDTSVETTSLTSCTLTRTGTELVVTVDLLNALADAGDLDAVQRRSGTSADALEPWPSEPIDDLADGARWLTDPAADGTNGELYLLDDNRLIRITVTTPLDYRRTPRSLATAIAPLLEQT